MTEWVLEILNSISIAGFDKPTLTFGYRKNDTVMVRVAGWRDGEQYVLEKRMLYDDLENCRIPLLATTVAVAVAELSAAKTKSE